MERIKRIERKPSLLLTSDWHLREDTPTCFTGNWHQEQWKAVEFVRDLQAKHNCPVVHAGDLFHHWKPSPWLLRMAMQYLPRQFYTIYGQHDLPQHNWELRGKSGVAVLEEAKHLEVLPNANYGQEPNVNESTWKGFPEPWKRPKRILVWHHMTYITPPYPGATGGNAQAILRKYPQFDLVCTGDNHQSFCVGHGKQLLVNPGNLTRQTADQIDFQPRVALWYAETNTIEWVNIPIQQGVITREHLEKKEERDERLSAFIEKLDSDYEIGLSFEQNLETYFGANDTPPDVKQIIYKSIENENF